MFSPFSLADLGINSLQTITLNINLQDVAYLIGLVFIHELIHLVFIPGFLVSDKTFLGITYFGGFVYSEEEISKSRYILITLAPFILLSIILAWNSGGSGSIKSVSQGPDIIKRYEFRSGYADLSPCTNPGAGRCVFYFQWDKDLLEKDR